MRHRRLAARLAALALIGGAAPAGGEGEFLATAADSAIAHWRHPHAEATLIAHGRTRAEPAEGGWRLRLPPLEWVSSNEDRLKIAGAILSIRPADGERAKLSLTLPSTMPILDRLGLNRGQVTLGRQRIEGLWDRRFDGLVRLEARLDQLRRQDGHGHESFHLATATLKARLEDKNGGWTLDVSDLATGGFSLDALDLVGSAPALTLQGYADAAKALGIDWRLGPQPNERASLWRQLPTLLGPITQEATANGIDLTGAGAGLTLTLESALAASAPGASYSGTVDASLAGLPELIQGGRNRLPGAGRSTLLLMAIQGFGRPRLGPDRRTLYDFHFDVGPDGRVGVNGHDATVLKELLVRP